MNEEQNWRAFETEDTYYVNINVDKYGTNASNDEFSKRGKVIWVIGPLILIVVVIAFIFMTTLSFAFTLIPAAIMALGYSYIIRKFVLDENKFKKLSADNAVNGEQKTSAFSNISTVQNGQIFYQQSDIGVQTGFIVTFDYSSILDNSLSANKLAIDNAFVPFFKQLHMNNYSVDDYDISIKHSISLGTLESIKKTRLLEKGSWLELIEMLQNELASSLEQNSGDDYRHFYVIKNTDTVDLTSMRENLETIINTTLGDQTSIVKPHILDNNEIVEFFANYFQIASFDIESTERNIKHLDVSKYFKFLHFYDRNGAMYSVGDFEPDTESSNSRQRQGMDVVLNQANRTEDREAVQAEKQAERDAKKADMERYRTVKSGQGTGIQRNRQRLTQRKRKLDLSEKQTTRQADIDRRKKEQEVQRQFGGLSLDDLLRQADNDKK